MGIAIKLEHALRNGFQRSLYVLAGILLMVTISIIAPRSARAEGFLLHTVRCLVQVVGLQQCKTTTPSSPSPSSSTPAEAEPAPSGAPASPADPAASSPAPLPLIEPLNDEQLSFEPLPMAGRVSEPTVQGRMVVGYTAHQAFLARYSASSYGAKTGDVIERSNDGWRIAGISWYWWLIFVGLLTGVILYRKYSRRRQSTVLSNPL